MFPCQEKNKRYLKSYWSAELTELHINMTKMRRAWVNAGKPRDADHNAYSEYKTEKGNFRRKH